MTTAKYMLKYILFIYFPTIKVFVRIVLCSHADYATQALPFKHIFKGFVDFRKRYFMGDKFLQFKFLSHLKQ